MSNKRKREEIKIFDYIYQKADYYPYHCAPFSLYNLLLNYNKYISLNKLINLCDPEPINGTSNEKFNKAIKILNDKFKIKITETEPTISNIIALLKSKRKIIVLFHWTEHFHKGEHYALIEKMIDCDKFKFINYSFDESVKIVSLRELKNIMRYYKSDEDVCPTLWTID